MNTTLFISTYNWNETLYLIFKSIKEKTQLQNKILTTNDGSREDAKVLIDKSRKTIYLLFIYSMKISVLEDLIS